MLLQKIYNILCLPNKCRLNKFIKSESKRKKQQKFDLRNFELKIFSQNGEDGIIQEIFNRIGTTNKYFVEFGIQSGEECNTRNLLENYGWKGLWIDGDKNFVEKAKKVFGKYPIKIVERFITKDNIETIFNEAGVPIEMDILSIDIDGNDYWVWEKIVNYNPRVVVIEYNGKYLPDVSWVMPYNETHNWDGSNYFGASLKSFNDLGVKKGYTLVGTNNSGLNAFFVRNDLLDDNFYIDKENNLEYQYSAPKYIQLFFGHPPRIIRRAIQFFGLQNILSMLVNK